MAEKVVEGWGGGGGVEGRILVLTAALMNYIGHSRVIRWLILASQSR